MRRQYAIALSIAVVSIVSIIIAYAALSTSLTLTVNKITQNVLTWNVAFQTASGQAATNTIGSSATGRSCGTASATATAVTVGNTVLSKPGDGCVYKFTVQNTGSIAAKIGSVTPTAPSGVTCTITNASGSASAKMVCGNITYQLVGGVSINTSTYVITPTNLTTGTSVAATSGTKDVYLVAQYTGTALNSSAVTQSGGKFTLTFDQA